MKALKLSSINLVLCTCTESVLLNLVLGFFSVLHRERVCRFEPSVSRTDAIGVVNVSYCTEKN